VALPLREGDVRDLVPSNLVADCLEVHLAQHAPTGRALYLTIIALAVGGGAALPVVHVPVTVQANGIIRPVIERQDARVGESGVVRAIYVRDGDRARAGDTLLALHDRVIGARLSAADSMARIRSDELLDLAALIEGDELLVSRGALRTPHRRQQLGEHVTITSELSARAATARREAERLQWLMARGFATPEQVEYQAAEERSAEAAVQEQSVRMRSLWSEARARIAEELLQLSAERAQLREARARHFVVAPVDGTVEMAVSLSPGSVLQGGERIATLSPNTELIGEAQLTARDIALVRRGTPARLMIDALNYRDWGGMDATVVEIADDATFVGDHPVFRVRCRLAGRALRLRGGQQALLGKGMTFRARFVIAQRSLLQLLFDRVEDWLNPARVPTPAIAGR
jgi:HlyD family secretion protein